MYGNLRTNYRSQFSPSTVGSGQSGLRLGDEHLSLLAQEITLEIV